MGSLRELNALISKYVLRNIFRTFLVSHYETLRQPKKPRERKSFEERTAHKNHSDFPPDSVDRNDDIDFNLPLISHPLEKSHMAWIDWNRIEPAIMNYLNEHQVQWSMLDLCYCRRPGFPYNDIAKQPVAFVIAQKSDPIA